MSKTKVWIIGAQGRLGSTISDALDRMAYNVLTSDMDVDITDMDSVTAYMDMSHPAVVINCAGYNTHNWLEEDMVKAFRVNAIGARNVASASRKVGAKLIHMSTDDVFDGQGNEPLNEFDTATPDTIFGKSKLAGENFVRELNPKHLIVRSSWVYAKEGSCFVNSGYLHHQILKICPSRAVLACFCRYFLNSACRILPHASKDLFCCFYTAAAPFTGSMINTIFIGINHLHNKISKHFGTCRTAVLFCCHLNDTAFFCLTNHRIYKTTALFGINP